MDEKEEAKGGKGAMQLPRAGSVGCNALNMPRVHSVIKQITKSAIQYTDGSEMDIPDHVIFATGYLFKYPFIDDNDVSDRLSCSSYPYTPPELLTDGHIVNDIYRYLLYIPNPTLSFFGLPHKATLFSLYEYQAHYLARVYLGKVPLPSFAQMQSEWQELVSEYRPVNKLYSFGPRQLDYINSLVDQLVACEGTSGRFCKLSRDSPTAMVTLNKLMLRIKTLGY
ncbi:monooxygenase [Coemansia sp. Benny D115]|nr:monooxygenase [Coemansia sp. Benny D115]